MYVLELCAMACAGLTCGVPMIVTAPLAGHLPRARDLHAAADVRGHGVGDDAENSRCAGDCGQRNPLRVRFVLFVCFRLCFFVIRWKCITRCVLVIWFDTLHGEANNDAIFERIGFDMVQSAKVCRSYVVLHCAVAVCMSACMWQMWQSDDIHAD
jgi:hypothetical protein